MVAPRHYHGGTMHVTAMSPYRPIRYHLPLTLIYLCIIGTAKLLAYSPIGLYGR